MSCGLAASRRGCSPSHRTPPAPRRPPLRAHQPRAGAWHRLDAAAAVAAPGASSAACSPGAMVERITLRSLCPRAGGTRVRAALRRRLRRPVRGEAASSASWGRSARTPGGLARLRVRARRLQRRDPGALQRTRDDRRRRPRVPRRAGAARQWKTRIQVAFRMGDKEFAPLDETERAASMALIQWREGSPDLREWRSEVPNVRHRLGPVRPRVPDLDRDLAALRLHAEARATTLARRRAAVVHGDLRARHRSPPTSRCCSGPTSPSTTLRALAALQGTRERRLQRRGARQDPPRDPLRRAHRPRRDAALARTTARSTPRRCC